jgi:hypothetical protein
MVVEGRSVHIKLRRSKVFRFAREVGASTSLVGLFVSVLGVATSGLDWRSLWIVWGAFVVDLLAFATIVVMIIATRELEEDESDEPNVTR